LTCEIEKIKEIKWNKKKRRKRVKKKDLLQRGGMLFFFLLNYEIVKKKDKNEIKNKKEMEKKINQMRSYFIYTVF
jgi:hypothetical protein